MRAGGEASASSRRNVPADFFLRFVRALPHENVVPPKNRMRRHTRLTCDAPMQIFWKDSHGRVQILRARCLDLSAEGARLETATPVPVRTSITLESALHGSLGSASVRHCVRNMLKYTIGVEFTSSLALAGAARKRCLADLQPPADSQP